jgi:hypothetical protein
LNGQDVILEKPKDFIKITDYDEVELEIIEMVKGKKIKKIVKKKKYVIYNEKKYNSVIYALQKGPLTLDEITKIYNELTNESKKKITIYTYVQDLITTGFVIKAGKRLTKNKNGKIISDTLYSHAAKIIFHESLDYWKKKEMGIIASKIGEVYDLYAKKTSSTKEIINELLEKIHLIREIEAQNFLKENVDEFIKIIGFDHFKDVNTILRKLGDIIILTKYNDFISEINKLKK